VFDTPSRRAAGKFVFRFWIGDTKSPRVRLLTQSIRAGHLLRVAVTDAGSGVDPGSLHAALDRRAPSSGFAAGARASRPGGSLGAVTGSSFRASDYQEAKNMENAGPILPNTRTLSATFVVSLRHRTRCRLEVVAALPLRPFKPGSEFLAPTNRAIIARLGATPVALVDRRQLGKVALDAGGELVALVELAFVGPQQLQLGLAAVAFTAAVVLRNRSSGETRPLGADDGEDRAGGGARSTASSRQRVYRPLSDLKKVRWGTRLADAMKDPALAIPYLTLGCDDARAPRPCPILPATCNRCGQPYERRELGESVCSLRASLTNKLSGGRGPGFGRRRPSPSRPPAGRLAGRRAAQAVCSKPDAKAVTRRARPFRPSSNADDTPPEAAAVVLPPLGDEEIAPISTGKHLPV
jgi:hypothetical protein